MAFVDVAVAAAAVVAAGASAYGAVAQGDASGKAAGISQANYEANKKLLTDAGNSANAKLDPYQSTGLAANNQLGYAMGLPSNTTGTGTAGALSNNFSMSDYQNSPLYTPMVNSLQDLQNTPGYQFQLNQGLQSVNNSAAAHGSLLSGGNIKAINDYAQGQASTGYQAAWQRAQQAYQSAFSNDTTNKNNTFNRLQTMGLNGQNAATKQGDNTINIAGAIGGQANINAANQMGNAIAQGQSNAAMASSIGNGITGLLGAYSSGSLGGSGGGYVGGLSGGSATSGWGTQSGMGFNNGAGWGA